MQSKQHLIICLPVSKPLLIVLQEACCLPEGRFERSGEMLIRGLALIARPLADLFSLLKGPSHSTPLPLLLVSDTAR